MSSIVREKWLFSIALLLVIIDLLFFNHLLELRNEEPRRAIVAIEMMHSGEYMIPHIFNEPYLNKPPVYNWILAGFFKIFGTGEWVVRLPGVLSLMATAFFLWKISVNYVEKQFRLLLPLIFLTTADLLYFGSVNSGEIDLFYSFIVCLQVYSIFWFHQKKQYHWLFLVSYILCAVGVLTKGIPSLAFQALTLLLYFILNKEFKKLFSIYHVLGITSLTLVVGGFFYYYSLHGDLPAFLSQQFKEASQRTGNEGSLIKLILQFFKFPLTLVEKLFPWSLLFIVLFIKDVRRSIWNKPLLRFSIIFVLANILIYWTAPDLRIRYIYMFFPFIILILVTAYSINQKEIKWLNLPRYIYSFGIGASGLGMIALPYILKIESTFSISISIILGCVLLALFYLSIKQFKTILHMWLLVFAMLLGRLGYNLIVIPKMSNLNTALHYESIVSDMLEITDGEKIYYTGDKQKIQPDISFLGNEIYKDEFYTPIDIPFQIPYYYSHLTGDIMEYREVVDEHSFFLMYKRDIWIFEGEKEYFYEFQANTNSEILVLFKISS